MGIGSILIHSLVAMCFSASIALSQTHQTKQKAVRFPYTVEKCPDFALIAASQWIPEAIDEYKNKLINCEVLKKTINLTPKKSITFVQYIYSFQEDSDYISKQQFVFIIDNSNQKILYKGGTPEFPHGALQDICLIKYNKQLIIEFEFFTGGTGGYWEEYFTYRDHKLHPISLSFNESAKSLIPKGYTVHRSSVDFAKMTAKIFLSTVNDANCCPSGRLDIQLALKENDLIYISGIFSPNN